MFNFKKKEIPEWKKEVLEDKRIIQAMKEIYLNEKIKQAKEEVKEMVKQESQKPKTLGQYFQGFLPRPGTNAKKKPNAFMDYMAELGKQSASKGGMFESPSSHKPTKGKND